MFYFIKKLIEVYTKDYDNNSSKESTNNAKLISAKAYSISEKRLNKILEYTEKYSNDNYEYIVLTINQYKKNHNDFLNLYLNNIYYTFYNKEKQLTS